MLEKLANGSQEFKFMKKFLNTIKKKFEWINEKSTKVRELRLLEQEEKMVEGKNGRRTYIDLQKDCKR